MASLSSCVFHKNMVLLNDRELKKDDDKTYQPQPLPGSPAAGPYQVRPGDQLYIRVVGFDEEMSTRDLINGGSPNIAGAGGDPGMAFTTYTVNDSGFIEMPLLGRLSVKDKSLTQVRDMITGDLGEYLQNPSTRVHLANFYFTIMGEVSGPGIQYVYEEQINMMQAIARGAGVTEFGDLRHVKLIRTMDDQSITVYLNLSDPKFPSSPYYYLHPGDVIYVEPVKAKATAINSQTASLFLSTLSLVAVLANVAFRINQQP
jgi:polysaccharide export outer membrane protein